jgi:hypothetical protein
MVPLLLVGPRGHQLLHLPRDAHVGREMFVPSDAPSAATSTGRAVKVLHSSSTSSERYPAGHVGHIANLSADHF